MKEHKPYLLILDKEKKFYFNSFDEMKKKVYMLKNGNKPIKEMTIYYEGNLQFTYYFYSNNRLKQFIQPERLSPYELIDLNIYREEIRLSSNPYYDIKGEENV